MDSHTKLYKSNIKSVSYLHRTKINSAKFVCTICALVLLSSCSVLHFFNKTADAVNVPKQLSQYNALQQQKLTNNRHIKNIHLSNELDINYHAKKLQVVSIFDAQIFYVPKKLDSNKGLKFKVELQDFLAKQTKPELLTTTINIFDSRHLPAAKDFKNYLISYGISKQYIQIKMLEGKAATNSFRQILLKTEYFKVYTPKCPNWENVSGGENSNFGCATAVNLAVHVANPRDLIIGRKLAPMPSQLRVQQLEDFYKGTLNQVKAPTPRPLTNLHKPPAPAPNPEVPITIDVPASTTP